MPGVIRRLVDEASRLSGVRCSHVVHSDGDRFDFEALIEDEESARFSAKDLSTHMLLGDERGVSGRLDRVVGTVKWSLGEGREQGSAEVTNLSDVIFALQEWRNRAIVAKGKAILGVAMAPLLPEFGDVIQLLHSMPGWGPSDADAAKLDTLLVALAARLEGRLRDNVADLSRLEPMLAALATELSEARALVKQRRGKDLTRPLLERIMSWMQRAHSR